MKTEQKFEFQLIFKINNGWMTFVEQIVLLQMQVDSSPGFCLQIFLCFACLLVFALFVLLIAFFSNCL